MADGAKRELPLLTNATLEADGSVRLFYECEGTPRVVVLPAKNCVAETSGSEDYALMVCLNLIAEQHQELQDLKALVNQHIAKGHIDGK